MNNSDDFSSMPGGPTKRGRATQHPERRRIWPWLLAGAAVVALGAGLWMTGGAGATGGEAAQNASQVSSSPNGAPVSAEQMAIDLQALADLKKAVGRRVAALDGTWTDGEFAKRRKVIADAQRELAACTEASSLARARELRGDIYDATDWIEHNTAARAAGSAPATATGTAASASWPSRTEDDFPCAGGEVAEARESEPPMTSSCDSLTSLSVPLCLRVRHSLRPLRSLRLKLPRGHCGLCARFHSAPWSYGVT